MWIIYSSMKHHLTFREVKMHQIYYNTYYLNEDFNCFLTFYCPICGSPDDWSWRIRWSHIRFIKMQLLTKATTFWLLYDCITYWYQGGLAFIDLVSFQLLAKRERMFFPYVKFNIGERARTVAPNHFDFKDLFKQIYLSESQSPTVQPCKVYRLCYLNNKDV